MCCSLSDDSEEYSSESFYISIKGDINVSFYFNTNTSLLYLLLDYFINPFYGFIRFCKPYKVDFLYPIAEGLVHKEDL